MEAELLRRTLARAGYAVSVAHNGEEGLQAARARRPALVMSDINMPVMNGYQLCRAIKYDDELWNIPLILLTVLSQPEDIIEAINSGADAYIIKPFAEAILLERIRSLLDAPIERRRAEERREEVVGYGGKRHAIAGGGQQILNLLLSLYENTLNQNRELVATQAQLNLLNESLDAQVRERTAALSRVNRTLRTLSEGNQALVRATSEEELLRDAVRNIVNNGGYRLAGIGYADDNPEKSITPVAWSGVEEGYYAQERPTWADTEKGQVPISRAIRNGKVQVCRDIATDAGFAFWRDTALTRGYAANIALPLADKGRVFGGLSIYSSEKGAFDEGEAQALEELAEDIAYGIVTLRARAALHAANQALREREEKYRQLFESSRDALMLLTPPAWRFIDANQATLQMFGATSKDDFASFAPWDASPERQPDGRPSAEKAKEMIAIALRDGSHLFEWEHRRLNGEIFVTDILLTRIESNGQVLLQATMRDITERKAAEAAVERERNRLDAILKTATDGIHILDAEGLLVDANDAFLIMLGYDRTAIGRLRAADFDAQLDAETIRKAIKKLIAQHDTMLIETRHRRTDGQIIDVEIYSRAVRMDGRDYVCASSRDITERKRTRPAAQALAGRGAEPGEHRHHRSRCQHRICQRRLRAHHRLQPRGSHRPEPAHPAIRQDAAGDLRCLVGRPDPRPDVEGRVHQQAQGRQRIHRVRHHHADPPGRRPHQPLRGGEGGHHREEAPRRGTGPHRHHLEELVEHAHAANWRRPRRRPRRPTRPRAPSSPT